MVKPECILPKYVLIGAVRGKFIEQVLAANDHIEPLRANKIRSGWGNNQNIRIYQMKE